MNRIRLEARPFKNIFDKYDSETDRYYNRIAAGVAWPSEGKPGAIAVIGEELIHRPVRKPKIFLLAEFESHSISELIDKTIFFRNDLCVDPFLAQRDHADYLQFRNREARKNRESEIYLQQPAQVNQSLEYYTAVIGDALNSGNKRLFLGEHSKLPAVLQQVGGSVAGLTVKDFPLLAACGYVVSAMLIAGHEAIKYEFEPDRCKTDYDLFRDY